MKYLYEMNVDCGRMGSLTGRFLATPEEVNALIGKDLYFGEVLGKHSEVYGPLDEKEVTLITDDVTFLSVADAMSIDLCSGYNPFHYYTCNECGGIKDPITDKCPDGCEEEE